MLIDNHAIAQGESRRAQINAATAEFLRNGGKIFIVDNKVQPQEPPKTTWNNNQGNRAAEDASRRRGVRNSNIAKHGGNTEYHKKMRADNVAAIGPLIQQGLSTEDIALKIGITARAVRRIIHDEGLSKPARRSKAA